VRVRFVIAADGSFDVVLRSSSGSGEVDEAVLSTARRWRWKPARRDGQAVSSSQTIRFTLNR
jgi:TonB family protein